MTLLITSAQRREISSGRLDARLVWTYKPRVRALQIVISKIVSDEKKSYIGDNLYNASRADMFLPTKKNRKRRYGRLFATRVSFGVIQTGS